MFQFTTTNVINGEKRVNGEEIWVSQSTEPKSFIVKRVGTFKPGNVTAVYRSKGYEGKKAKAVIDLSKVPADAQNNGQQLRLNMWIGLSQGSNFSLYSNDTYFKGKPFIVDFVWKDDEATTATKLVEIIKKYTLAIHGEKMVNVTDNDGTIELEAVNEYQKFEKVQLEVLNEKAHRGFGEFELVEDAAEITPGYEGFGTYSYILHNLRLPTRSHTDFMAPKQDEMPIPGAIYDEFVIHMCTPRGTLGLNAVGDQVTSHTTHVFYVLSSLTDDFKQAIEQGTEATVEEVTIKDIPQD